MSQTLWAAAPHGDVSQQGTTESSTTQMLWTHRPGDALTLMELQQQLHHRDMAAQAGNVHGRLPSCIFRSDIRPGRQQSGGCASATVLLRSHAQRSAAAAIARINCCSQAQ